MGMCALYEGCALPALVGRLQQVSAPMTAIRGSRIGLLVPSIAHPIISLCSVAD